MGFEIKKLSHQIRRAIDKDANVGRHGLLTGAQLRILGFVGENFETRDVYQKDIENEFNIRRSTATGMLQLMEKNGLIYRERVEHDARLKKITLTDKAMQIHLRMKHVITQLEERIVFELSEQQLHDFIETIHKISKNLEEFYG